MAEKNKEIEEMAEVSAAEETPIKTEEIITEEPVEPTEKPISRSRTFIMSKFPDKSYDDDDAYEEDLANYLEDTDKSLKAYKDADEQLEDILMMNPELALVITDMKKGVPFMSALAKNVDLDDLAPIKGEPDYEEFEKLKAERKAELKAKKDREDMLRTNAEQSASEILEYLANKGWSEERRAEFDGWFDKLMSRLAENHLGKDEMDIFVKAYEYDENAARAEEKGRIAGRNEKIEAKRKMKENVDDLPEGGSTSRVETTAPRQRQVIDINKLLGK